MSKHLEFLQETVERSALRLSADAIGLAVALTENELITAKAGLLRRWSRVERYPLQDLVDLRVIPNPSANLLQLHFSSGEHARVVAIMYPPESSHDFDRLVTLLRDRISKNQREAGHDG